MKYLIIILSSKYTHIYHKKITSPDAGTASAFPTTPLNVPLSVAISVKIFPPSFITCAIPSFTTTDVSITKPVLRSAAPLNFATKLALRAKVTLDREII